MMNICSVLRHACFGCKKKSLLAALTTNVERERTDKHPRTKTHKSDPGAISLLE